MAISINNILGLPLFTGLTQKELEQICNTTSFSMSHVKKGGIIADAESVCDKLCFVVQGWIEVTTMSDDRTYSMSELMQATHTIEPDKLFGLHQRFRAQYTAVTSCEVISITKESLLNLLSQYLIVRLNYLSMVCRKAQQTEHSIWRATDDDLKIRIRQFIRERTLYPAGRKVLHITMSQLAKELNASRLDVSIALNEMAENDKIILKRGIIEIPALQLL